MANLKRNEPRGGKMRSAARNAKSAAPIDPMAKYRYEVKAPVLAPGVVPNGERAPVQIAMDDATGFNQYYSGSEFAHVAGFPGYPYLAMLATRAEYRAFAASLSTEITREWIEFTSSDDDDTETADQIKEIEAEFARLNVKGVIQKVAEHDCYFGRGQIFIKIAGADRSTPLVIDSRTIKKGSLEGFTAVEAMWTTPNAYNALDPAAADFYKPSSWFMLGQKVHASRLMTIITRPLPDMLKPAFNFSGMSLSQLAEPYVDNWLRTRQSVADLINNFSITALKTAMDQVLQGNDDGADLAARADLFTAYRSNRGLMLLDKDREELVQLNVPLSGLDALQAQSQEHMCSVSRMPAIILTGISPTGLNASSEGEIRCWNDWIAAQQSAYYQNPIEIILKIVQLNLFGKINQRIGFRFVPLYQLNGKEEAEVRTANGTTDLGYVNAGVLDPAEVRERLAKDPLSGYQGIDVSALPVPPALGPSEGEEPPEGLGEDAEFHEEDHPRADNGQFGSGSGGKKSKGKQPPDGMTFAIFKTVRDTLDKELSDATAELKKFPREKDGRYSDATKALPGWREARTKSDAAFKAMQAFNGKYVKYFPNEIKNEIAEKRKAAVAQDHIVEEGGKFKLLSHEGKNLGVFDTREEAEKHEQQVNYFKSHG